jgi:hypothetical protein
MLTSYCTAQGDSGGSTKCGYDAGDGSGVVESEGEELCPDSSFTWSCVTLGSEASASKTVRTAPRLQTPEAETAFNGLWSYGTVQ